MLFNKAPDSPEYGAASDKLKSYVLSSSQMEKSVNAMTKRIKEIARFYNEFAQKIFSTWLHDAPPAVAQADEVVQKNAATFENLVDALINQMGPHFFNLLTIHDAKVKELQALEKKRLNALKEMERKDSALKSQQNAKEPVESKIQAAQVQYDQAKSQFDEVNAQFLEQVSAFGEKRNVELLQAFQNFMAMFCQLVNQASLLQPIDFPEDQNADVVDIPTPQPAALPPSNPQPAAVQTPAPAQPAQPAQQPYSQQPEPVNTQQQQPEVQPVDAYNTAPEQSYNPPPAEPPAQQEQAYNDTSYNDTSYNNTYNDTSYNNTSYNDTSYNDASYNNTTYNDTSYNNTSYNDTSYNQQSYNDPSTQNTYDASASNNDTAKDPHQTKNPFDEDDDGWGANPFG